MPGRLTIAAASLSLALLLSAGALAQSSTAPAPSGQSAAPPTTGSEQSVNPPNAVPGSTAALGSAAGNAMPRAAPGSAPPENVRTTNPASDAKTNPVK